MTLARERVIVQPACASSSNARANAKELILRAYDDRTSSANAFAREVDRDGVRRLVMIRARADAGDDGLDDVIGCVELRRSCAMYGNEWASNVLMELVLVAPEARGCGYGKTLVARAREYAFRELRADVVSAYCEETLIGFYTSSACGFVYEEPRGKRAGERGLEACVRAFASEETRARYDAGRAASR